jgi:Ca2+-binding EF-hand superfamily protein
VRWTAYLFVPPGLALAMAGAAVGQTARPNLLPSPGAPATAAAPAGDVSRAQFIASMDAEFRRLDLNRDGEALLAEIDEALRGPAMAEALARNGALFTQLDSDRSGNLSPAEFAKLVELTGVKTDAPSIFSRFDTNRDGKVSLLEHRTVTQQNFDLLDRDKDGIVTAAEMRAAGIGR